jgi:hypothetical protein
MPTPAVILANAPIACYLAAKKIEKSTIRGGGYLDPELPQKIYIVYKLLKEIYDNDPTYDGVVAVSNYLWELCGEFGIAALAISGGGGGSVVPVSPGNTTGILFEYLIEVRGGIPDFANATDYDDSRVVGHDLVIFWNDIPRFLIAGTEWAYTPTGFRILVGGFDASINDYYLIVFIKDPLGVSGATNIEVTRAFQYTGIGGETSITSALLSGGTIVSVTRGTPYEMIFSGSPVGLQALVNLDVNNHSNGTINFDPTNPISLGEVVEIIFSKSV